MNISTLVGNNSVWSLFLTYFLTVLKIIAIMFTGPSPDLAQRIDFLAVFFAT